MPEFDISQYQIEVTMDEDENSQDGNVSVVETIRPPKKNDTETLTEDESSSSSCSVPLQTSPSMPWNRWLFTQLYQHLNNQPDQIALIEEVCEARCVSYAELLDGVMKTANYLVHHGVSTGMNVGICMENCVEYIFYQLALFLIGAVPVLFNPAHIACDRVSKINISVIVSDSEHYGHVLRSFDQWMELQKVFVLAENLASIYVPRNVWVLDGFGFLDFPCEFSRKMEEGAGTVVAFTTSGTSTSKGKVVGHSSWSAQILCSNYYTQLFGLLKEKWPEQTDGCHLVTGGLHSIDGWGHLLFSLLSGQTAVIAESNADIWRASFLDRIAGLIEQYKIPVIIANSQLLNCLVKYEIHKLFNISSLKILAHTGSTIPSTTVETLKSSLDVTITQAYSSTEFGVISFAEVGANSDTVPTAGDPFLGTDVKIANLIDETEVSPGSWGRIMIRADSLFNRYLGEEAPAQILTKNGWFRTDDYGMLDEQARLYVAGPIDGIITVKDKQYSLATAESILISIDSIDDVALALLDDVISAGVVLKEGEVPPSAAQLSSQLREKDIDLSVEKVVLVDFIPRSETGKILRLEVPFLLRSEDTFEENESSI